MSMMRRGFVVWMVFFAFGMSAWAVAAPPVENAASAESALTAGAQFERAGKWIGAIEEYEKALKLWPDNKDLKYGLRRSKVQFGIQRRCDDPSYRQTLRALSRSEAITLFDDVLDQVRTSYVEPVSDTSFVAHGTESLYYALANQTFLDRNLPRGESTSVWQLRELLRKNYWNKPVSQQGRASDVVSEVCDVAQRMVGLPASVVVMEYVFGGCNALDEYSSYLTPSRLEDLYDNIDGQFVGLGVEIKAVDGEGILLVSVLPESPAAEGGLGPGDRIVSVNGVNCRNMTTDEAADLLRGPPESRVRLQVLTSAAVIRETSLLRKTVTVRSIPIAAIVDRENGIGYIRMTGFQKSTANELDRALYQLRQQGMRSLIWDLRGNPGGLLNTAVEVLDRFIEAGVLVSTRGRTLDQNLSYSAHASGTWKLPLVLLIDEDSASASEIVAGAIRDHNRGALVGRTSYGKWSVQSIFPTRYSSGLRLTTAKFYGPRGENLAKIGVEPHIKVESRQDNSEVAVQRTELDPATDVDVRKAIEVLKQRSSRG